MNTTSYIGSPSFTIEKNADGDVVLTITDDTDPGSEITINTGSGYSGAEELADSLDTLNDDMKNIMANWEDTPDDEDGYISFYNGAYYARLSGSYIGDDARGFPSRDIAEYELAKAMATAGYFPNCWLEGERGGYDLLDLSRFNDDEGNIKPLEGVQHETGSLVSVPERLSDWTTWVVDGDYGTMGLMLHTSGDPSVTLFVEGSDREGIIAWGEENEDEDAGWTPTDEEAGNCTTEHPCPVRAARGHGECEHTS